MKEKTTITMHSFSVRIAEEVGVERAVLIQNIQFWVDYNMNNKSNFYDGKYWVYNSAKAFQAQFPYMSKDKIQRNLKWLVDNGYLESGNYNKSAYDRTKWYTISEKTWEILNVGEFKSVSSKSENCVLEDTKSDFGKVDNALPIPNINTNINTDTNTDNNIYNEAPAQTGKTKLRDIPQEFTSQVIEIMDYLNESRATLGLGKVGYDVQAVRKDLVARLKEGYTVEDAKDVIYNKLINWRSNKDMHQYFKPATLFCKKHFSNYLYDVPKGGGRKKVKPKDGGYVHDPFDIDDDAPF